MILIVKACIIYSFIIFQYKYWQLGMMKNQAAYNQLQAYASSMDNKNNTQQRQTLDSYSLSPQILSQIKIVHASNLRIEDNHRPQIIQQISHITFPSLTYLNLRKSGIANIEAIQFLQCPVLTTLEIYGNHITNMNSLIKNNQMTHLKTLTFYGNPLKQKWKLQKANMPELTEFQLDQNQNSTTTIEDLSFLLKTPGKIVTKIYANSQNRIKQPKILHIINSFKQNQ